MEATARKTRGAELSFWARLSVVAFLALVAASINSKLAPAVAEGLLTSTSCQVAPWSSERCNLPAALIVQRTEVLQTSVACPPGRINWTFAGEFKAGKAA